MFIFEDNSLQFEDHWSENCIFMPKVNKSLFYICMLFCMHGTKIICLFYKICDVCYNVW